MGTFTLALPQNLWVKKLDVAPLQDVGFFALHEKQASLIEDSKSGATEAAPGLLSDFSGARVGSHQSSILRSSILIVPFAKIRIN
jgi:hypothetical protein